LIALFSFSAVPVAKLKVYEVAVFRFWLELDVIRKLNTGNTFQQKGKNDSH
jgi:hypothetical protein